MLNTIFKGHVKLMLAILGLKQTKTVANFQQNDMLSMILGTSRVIKILLVAVVNDDRVMSKQY